LQKLAVVCAKNANFFANFFGKKFLKIITSVQDWTNLRQLSECLLWVVFENYRSSTNFEATISQRQTLCINFDKTVLEYMLGVFIANVSGHPVPSPSSIMKLPFSNTQKSNYHFNRSNT
jgi:hypothetical protein